MLILNYFLLIIIIIVTKGCRCELSLLTRPDLCIQLACTNIPSSSMSSATGSKKPGVIPGQRYGTSQVLVILQHKNTKGNCYQWCDLRMNPHCSRAEGAFKKVFHANFLFNESFLKLLETLLGFDLFCSGLTHSFPSNKTLNS